MGNSAAGLKTGCGAESHQRRSKLKIHFENVLASVSRIADHALPFGIDDPIHHFKGKFRTSPLTESL
jgi:hypothetical protein